MLAIWFLVPTVNWQMETKTRNQDVFQKSGGILVVGSLEECVLRHSLVCHLATLSKQHCKDYSAIFPFQWSVTKESSRAPAALCAQWPMNVLGTAVGKRFAHSTFWMCHSIYFEQNTFSWHSQWATCYKHPWDPLFMQRIFPLNCDAHSIQLHEGNIGVLWGSRARSSSPFCGLESQQMQEIEKRSPCEQCFG